MKLKNKPSSGLSIHCHHDVLVEYCYDYDERVASIKKEKPKNEQEIRLRVFKILPKKAEKDIPADLRQADQTRKQAYQAWKQANQTRKQADQTRKQADQAWKQANQTRKQADQTRKQADQTSNQAYRAWPQESKDAFHAKWCNCKSWNGKELVFNS